MLIKPEHFKARHGLYHPRCLKEWVVSNNLSWQTFLKEGYDHKLLLEIAPEDPDLLELCEYYELGSSLTQD